MRTLRYLALVAAPAVLLGVAAAPSSGATSDQLQAALLAPGDLPSTYALAVPSGSPTPTPSPGVTVSDPQCQPLVRGGGLDETGSAEAEYDATAPLPAPAPSVVDIRLASADPTQLDNRFSQFDSALAACTNFDFTSGGKDYAVAVTSTYLDTGLDVPSAGYSAQITVDGMTAQAVFLVARVLDDTVVEVTAFGDDPNVFVPDELLVPQLDKAQQLEGGGSPAPPGATPAPAPAPLGEVAYRP